MSQPNRIESLLVTPSVERQSPQDGFGAVLARTVGAVARGAASVLGLVAPGGAVVSAAVGGVASALGQGGGHGGPLTSEADVAALLEQPGELSSQDYLRLQQYMQHESQQFAPMSNIMKVRSDSAKAAINNIR